MSALECRVPLASQQRDGETVLVVLAKRAATALDGCKSPSGSCLWDCRYFCPYVGDGVLPGDALA